MLLVKLPLKLFVSLFLMTSKKVKKSILHLTVMKLEAVKALIYWALSHQQHFLTDAQIEFWQHLQIKVLIGTA